jgi:hypothetical protein
MPGVPYTDNDGHATRQGSTALTAGAVSTSAAGTISPTTSAGATPTVTFTTGFTCDDTSGTFELNPVTGGGAQAAGQVALVRFAKPYPKTPNVTVSLYNHTDTTAAIVAGPGSVGPTGFDVLVGTALTTAKVYRVSYVVSPQSVTT